MKCNYISLYLCVVQGKTLIIGIDPDVNKNGVAIYNKHKKSLELKSLTFFELFEYLNSSKSNLKKVVIEGGWLNKKSNFHNERSGVRVAAKIGSHTGANHEVGRKIVEMCEYLQIQHKVQKPLRKIWKGPDRKITHKELVSLTGIAVKRTNQEQRDAALLVWGY